MPREPGERVDQSQNSCQSESLPPLPPELTSPLCTAADAALATRTADGTRSPFDHGRVRARRSLAVVATSAPLPLRFAPAAPRSSVAPGAVPISGEGASLLVP